MDLTYLMDLLGFGGPGASYAKPQPGVSVPKGVSTAASANPDIFGMDPAPDTLADSIGPWSTTVTPAEAVGAATGTKTFGDKLSDALSGLGSLQQAQVQGPSASDAAAIGKLLLSAMPATALPSLAAALPRGRR